ncbi:MAG: glycosyltransferase family 39 protein [Deltaproteobacteria bacterium]|nr:glycosyltransferase family 39 protein [Deltaproteobacteria bacterium]
MKNSVISILFVVVIFSIGIAMGKAYISCGQPYIYDMDEQKHQAILLNMMKQGAWDPDYYQKPALHFYLRLPVTMATYFYLLFRGELRHFDQIKFHDSFNRGSFSCASNPPEILLVNRFLSLLLVLSAMAVFGLIIAIKFGLILSCFFAFSFLLSYPFIEYCCRFSVDPPAVLFVSLTAFFCFLSFARKDNGLLYVAALFAGLSFSTKYNFAVVVLLPVIISLIKKQKLYNILLLIGIFFTTFFLINPFIFLNYREFIDDLTRQISHYRDPGIKLQFYDRLGINVSWIIANIPWYCLPGLILSLVFSKFRGFAVASIALIFLFVIQMSLFRQFFFRNFFPLFPMILFLGHLGIGQLLACINNVKFKFWLNFLLLGLSLPIGIKGLKTYFDYRACPETRRLLDMQLVNDYVDQTFLSGQICSRTKTQRLYHVEVFDERKSNILELAKKGGAYFIFSEQKRADLVKFLRLNKVLLGTAIGFPVINPTIYIYEVDPETLFSELIQAGYSPNILNLQQCVDHFCSIQSPFTKLSSESRGFLKIRNIWPTPNKVGIFCGFKKVLELRVSKEKELKLALSEIKCEDKILWVQNIFIPEKLFIPDKNPHGVSIKYSLD